MWERPIPTVKKEWSNGRFNIFGSRLTNQSGREGWLISVAEGNFRVHTYWVSGKEFNELSIAVRSTRGQGSMLISTGLSKWDSDEERLAVHAAICDWENEKIAEGSASATTNA
jgi:hypothetical protein